MNPLERIEELEARVQHLEDALYESLKNTNDMWLAQHEHNVKCSDAAKVMISVSGKMEKMASVVNQEMDQVWHFVDQISKMFKLKALPKKKPKGPSNDHPF